MLDIADQEGWIESINDVEEFCIKIPHSRSFADALKGELHNEDVVHLVITAKGYYQEAVVEERDEGHDVLATEFPEMKRAL